MVTFCALCTKLIVGDSLRPRLAYTENGEARTEDGDRQHQEQPCGQSNIRWLFSPGLHFFYSFRLLFHLHCCVWDVHSWQQLSSPHLRLRQSMASKGVLPTAAALQVRTALWPGDEQMLQNSGSLGLLQQGSEDGQTVPQI